MMRNPIFFVWNYPLTMILIGFVVFAIWVCLEYRRLVPNSKYSKFIIVFTVPYIGLAIAPAIIQSIMSIPPGIGWILGPMMGVAVYLPHIYFLLGILVVHLLLIAKNIRKGAKPLAVLVVIFQALGTFNLSVTYGWLVKQF